MEVVKCRCCLDTKGEETTYSLLSVFPDLGQNDSPVVLDVLESVTCSEVFCHEKLPSEICNICVENLKNAYTFILEFKNAQEILEKLLRDTPDVLTDQNNDDVDYYETLIIQPDDLNVSEDENKVLIKTEDETTEDATVNSLCKIDIHDSANADVAKTTLNFREIEDSASECNENKEYQEEDSDLFEKTDSETNFNGSDNYVKLSSENKKKKEAKNDPKVNSDNEIKTRTKNKNTKKAKDNVIVMSVEDVLANKSDTDKVITPDQVKKMKHRSNYKRKDEHGAFLCKKCDKVFFSKRRLWQHTSNIHNAAWEEKYKCKECGEQKRTPSQLRYHMRNIHSKMTFKCDACDKEYNTRIKLNYHIKVDHQNVRKHICPVCGKRYKDTSGIKYHMLQHDTDKNFQCKICGKILKGPATLKHHERLHTGERPYKCRHCDADFTGPSARKKHEYTHTGNKPHRCPYCPRKFISHYNMTLHGLQHSGEYECELCDKGFIDEKVLEFHLHKVHKTEVKCENEDN